MSSQQALMDFLIYSYFKIIPKVIYGDSREPDYLTYRIKKAIMKAYEDATNEGAYNTLCALASNYEEWHKNTCEGLYKKYSKVCLNENEPFFTYGNAQKWVNMTMKYLWLLGLLDNTVDCERLHIPIDSFIIDAMWSDQNVNLPLRPENGDRSKTYAKPSDHVLGWSQWDDIMYGAFRSGLPEKYSLCWENDAWIEQAEKRKKADLKKQYESFFGEIAT